MGSPGRAAGAEYLKVSGLQAQAVVIVGGLITSTLLDIIVTPTLFYRFGRKSAETYVKQDPHQDPLERTT